MRLLLQNSLVQSHGSSEAGADENAEVTAQDTLVHSGNGVVGVQSSHVEVLCIDQICKQALGKAEDEGIKLQLGIGLQGGASG